METVSCTPLYYSVSLQTDANVPAMAAVLRCKVIFEKNELSIRHYLLPVEDPDNDADFYDRMIGKVDQDIVKAQSKAVTQPSFSLFWTDQDGDAICVDSEDSLQVALSYVKPDAAGFSVLRLVAKFSQNGTVKLSSTTNGKLMAIRGKRPATPASVSPKKKPNGYAKTVTNEQLESPETSPRKPIIRASSSKAAVEVMEDAMDEYLDETVVAVFGTGKPVLCPGCDEQFANWTTFRKMHWATCLEIEDRDQVLARCCACRGIFDGKSWNYHQRRCHSIVPQTRGIRKKSAVPVLCPGCDQKLPNWNSFRTSHWAECNKIDNTDVAQARCCKCREVYSGPQWCKHQRFCKAGTNSSNKSNGSKRKGKMTSERKRPGPKLKFSKGKKLSSRKMVSKAQKTCNPGCGHVFANAANLRRHTETCKMTPKTSRDGLDDVSEQSEGLPSPEKSQKNEWCSWARSASPEIPVSVAHSSEKRSVSPASTEQVDGNPEDMEETASSTVETRRDMDIGSIEDDSTQMNDLTDVKPDLASLNSHLREMVRYSPFR